MSSQPLKIPNVTNPPVVFLVCKQRYFHLLGSMMKRKPIEDAVGEDQDIMRIIYIANSKNFKRSVLSSLAVFLMIFLSNCTQKNSSSGNSELGNNFNVTIQDSVQFNDILNVSDFIMSNSTDEELYFADNEQGRVGKQIFGDNPIEYIGSAGRGPFEYSDPALVRVNNSRTFVWDASQLKFLVYDRNGNGIAESATLDRSLSDFDVINNDSLALLMSGGFEGPSVGIYSFSQGRIIEESLTGVKTKTDRLLDILNGTGAILADYPYVLYVLPSSPDIHRINVITGEEERSEIQTPYFNTDNFDGDVHEFVNNRRDDLIVYLLSNSSSMGLFKHNEYYILQTVNGVSSVDHNNPLNTSHKNRFHMFYLLNIDLEVVGYLRKAYDTNKKYEINDRYFYELKFELDNSRYTLIKAEIAL